MSYVLLFEGEQEEILIMQLTDTCVQIFLVPNYFVNSKVAGTIKFAILNYNCWGTVAKPRQMMMIEC